MRQIASGESFEVPPTIDDAAMLPTLEKQIRDAVTLMEDKERIAAAEAAVATPPIRRPDPAAADPAAQSGDQAASG